MIFRSQIQTDDQTNRVSFNLVHSQVFIWCKNALLIGFLISCTWLPALPMSAAMAMPDLTTLSVAITPRSPAASDNDRDRVQALATCLPKQLSQASWQRAWDEMGNDQVQRIFNLKPYPKLSQAEIELNACMSRQGFPD